MVLRGFIVFGGPFRDYLSRRWYARTVPAKRDLRGELVPKDAPSRWQVRPEDVVVKLDTPVCPTPSE